MTVTQAQIEAAAKALMTHPAIFFNDDNAPETNLALWLPVAQAALTAAAQVGEPETKYVWARPSDREKEWQAATIERCAQVAERYAVNIGEIAFTIAAELRKLKDAP